jgi:hypothetical protein
MTNAPHYDVSTAPCTNSTKNSKNTQKYDFTAILATTRHELKPISQHQSGRLYTYSIHHRLDLTCGTYCMVGACRHILVVESSGRIFDFCIAFLPRAFAVMSPRLVCTRGHTACILRQHSRGESPNHSTWDRLLFWIDGPDQCAGICTREGLGITKKRLAWDSRAVYHRLNSP